MSKQIKKYNNLRLGKMRSRHKYMESAVKYIEENTDVVVTNHGYEFFEKPRKFHESAAFVTTIPKGKNNLTDLQVHHLFFLADGMLMSDYEELKIKYDKQYTALRALLEKSAELQNIINEI